ncbi:MAG TPA: hypothetical protein PLB96_10640 [Syntrophales bacterium]|nr:hypothetical protein [Syntrophales bacterium]
MKKTLSAMLIMVLLASPVAAEELFVHGGAAMDTETHNLSGQWSISYVHHLDESAALSLTYLNEGHQPYHYRDSLAAQIWGKTKIPASQFSLALGIGPLVYFDTRVVPLTDRYEDAHGLGVVTSATATWYGLSPLLFQVRLNYITVRDSFDTLAATAGIGYLLDAPTAAESRPHPARDFERPADEIALYFGYATLNSAKSETDVAGAIEYRRHFGRHVDWTVTFLGEGDHRPLGRYGITSQLWVLQPFFSDRLELGMGFGPYVARDEYGNEDGSRMTALAGNISAMAAWRLSPRVALRAIWSRIVTDYHRDTDVYLGGLSYSF